MMLLAVLIFSILPVLCSANTASVHVAGTLFCNGEPWVNASLSIYDKNYALSDTLMATAFTDEQGYFDIKASATEFIFKIKPYVYIENWCVPMKHWWSGECAHRVNAFIPDAFVSDGHLPKATYNMDNIEMSTLKSENRGLGAIIYSIGTSKACRD